MDDKTLQVLAALQVLHRLGVSGQQALAVLEGPEPTEDTVRAALAQTDATIAEAREV